MDTIEIRIIQTKVEPAKLSFVKAIKDLTGFGLKESKDLTDILNDRQRINGKGEITMTINSYNAENKIKEFETQINEFCKGNYIVEGRSALRQRKFLELGIEDKDGYIAYILEHMSDEDTRVTILSMLTIEQLKEIFNIIKR